MNKFDNSQEPVYPQQGYIVEPMLQDHPYYVQPRIGLTKREYFAGLAMMAANAEYLHGNNPMPVPEAIANHSILVADELLKQLDNAKAH